jgi:hypothetical protein
MRGGRNNGCVLKINLRMGGVPSCIKKKIKKGKKNLK